jgi:hypothetical protein
MSSWNELLDRAEPEEHVVQLYGRDDQLLTRNVARFLGEGLRRGDGLIMIATPEHTDAVLRHLQAESADAAVALQDGRLVVLDARTTLDRFMVDGVPDEQRFRQVIGGVLADVRGRAASGRIRAFGEMVGLLWVNGQESAAIRLEQCWNDLLVGSNASLFCGYPIDIFDTAAAVPALDAVLRAHTHMYAGPQTMLSSSRAPH